MDAKLRDEEARRCVHIYPFPFLVDIQASTFLKACTDQLLTSSPCKILPHPLMPCSDIWDLFQAGNNGYKKRLMIGTTRDRDLFCVGN